MLRAVRLLAVWLLLAFLTIRESKAKGEWKTAGTWTPEGKPTAEDDLTLTGSFEIKAGLSSIARSLRATATGILTGAGEPVIGTSTAPADNIAISINSAATLTPTGTLKLATTVTSTAQTVDLGGKPWPSRIVFNAAGKWKLLNKLASSGVGASGQIILEAGTLEGNGQTLEGSTLNLSGASSIDLTGATVRCVAGFAGEGWNWGSTGTLTTSAATVIEIGGTEPSCQFGGGGKTYKGTIKLIGRTCRVDSASGQTIEGNLEILNKGTAAGGIDFKESATTTLTAGAVLKFNGTLAERCRIESDVAGKQHKLKLPGDYEPANSFVAVKDFKVEGGTLYLPNGEDLGGNEGIIFEAKPAEGETPPRPVTQLARRLRRRR